jgi:hypothetical protein
LKIIYGLHYDPIVYDPQGNKVVLMNGHTLSNDFVLGRGRQANLGIVTNNRISGDGYDAAGNMTSDGLYSYTYNAENEQTSNTAGETYTYDGDGKRVKKANSRRIYWYGLNFAPLLDTDLAGDYLVDYVFLNGQRLVRRDLHGGIYYYVSAGGAYFARFAKCAICGIDKIQMVTAVVVALARHGWILIRKTLGRTHPDQKRRHDAPPAKIPRRGPLRKSQAAGSVCARSRKSPWHKERAPATSLAGVFALTCLFTRHGIKLSLEILFPTSRR